MNNYLSILGENLKEIRKALSWTQQEFAEKMGVSRVTIVNIEKKPEKLDKTKALALYTLVTNELTKRKSKLNEIDFKSIKQEKEKEKLLKTLMGIGLTASVISSPFVMAFLGPLGVIASSFVKAMSKSNSKGIEELLEKYDSEEIEKFAYKSFKQIYEKINEAFEMDDVLDINKFVDKIQN